MVTLHCTQRAADCCPRFQPGIRRRGDLGAANLEHGELRTRTYYYGAKLARRILGRCGAFSCRDQPPAAPRLPGPLFRAHPRLPEQRRPRHGHRLPDSHQQRSVR
jgi:hypothetical protein